MRERARAGQVALLIAEISQSWRRGRDRRESRVRDGDNEERERERENVTGLPLRARVRVCALESRRADLRER